MRSQDIKEKDKWMMEMKRELKKLQVLPAVLLSTGHGNHLEHARQPVAAG